uniref:Transposase n=1 Tax=Magnetococcus massalia (strain MO-1) TaxID=451514 RepID=A0A1S7LJS0_MAGMO|nr:protein of unknown function [Candidatus Magnetococcus massalia]
MIRSVKTWTLTKRVALKERMGFILTLVALRHQIRVLQRSGRRPDFRPSDRLIWVFLASTWDGWDSGL